VFGLPYSVTAYIRHRERTTDAHFHFLFYLRTHLKILDVLTTNKNKYGILTRNKFLVKSVCIQNTNQYRGSKLTFADWFKFRYLEELTYEIDVLLQEKFLTNDAQCLIFKTRL
jgi:hypothetical protein